MESIHVLVWSHSPNSVVEGGTLAIEGTLRVFVCVCVSLLRQEHVSDNFIAHGFIDLIPGLKLLVRRCSCSLFLHDLLKGLSQIGKEGGCHTSCHVLDGNLLQNVLRKVHVGSQHLPDGIQEVNNGRGMNGRLGVADLVTGIVAKDFFGLGLQLKQAVWVGMGKRQKRQ